MPEYATNMNREDSFDSITVVTPPANTRGPARDMPAPTPARGLRAVSFKCRALQYDSKENGYSPESNAQVDEHSMPVQPKQNQHVAITTINIPLIQRIIFQGVRIGRLEAEVAVMLKVPRENQQTLDQILASVNACILTESQLDSMRQWYQDNTIRQITPEELDWEMEEGRDVRVAPHLREWQVDCWTIVDPSFQDETLMRHRDIEGMDQVMDSSDLVDEKSWARDHCTIGEGSGSEAGPSSAV